MYFFQQKGSISLVMWCRERERGDIKTLNVNFYYLKIKKSADQTLGPFAYYSQWIYNYSSKIHSLSTTTFSVTKEAEVVFSCLEEDVKIQ